MKKLMFIVAMAIGLVACHEEKTDWGGVGNGDDGAVGYIAFAEDGLSVNVDNESAAGEIKPMGTRAVTEEQLAAYTIEIWNEAGEKVSSFVYGERNTKYATSPYDSSRKGVAVPVGRYTVKAYSYSATAGMPEESATPEYAGETTVEVSKEAVAHASITCKLASVKVSVRFDPILASLITDATESRVALGATTISDYVFKGRPVTPAADDATLSEGLSKMAWDVESGSRYLRPNEAVNPLVLYLTTTYNGSAIKDQALKVVDDAKPGEWRKITVKLENGDSGTIYIKVEVSTWVNGEEVDCDVTKVAINMGEAGIPDDSDAPVIERTDHDISQPFTISDAMFNSAGAYTEGAAFTVKTKSEITSFKLGVASTNTDLSAAVADMGLNVEGGLELTGTLATTTKMIVGSWGFPTSGIAGVAELAFDLSALMKDLHTNYSGTHTFTMTVADKNGSSTTVELNITAGIVIDPNIQWVGYNIDQRYDIYATDDDPTTMEILVTAKSGIKSLIVTIEGPLTAISPETGTSLLEDVKMPSSFDLVAPGKNLAGGELSTTLAGLGFPTGDAVKDKTSLSFDITGFKSMLAVAPGETNFKLTLVDNDGNEIEKSMMINMIVE